MTVIRDGKADVTPIGYRQYNIRLQSKVTVPRQTPEGDNMDNTTTIHVHIHVKTHKGSVKAINTSSRDAQLALKTHKENCQHKTPEGDNHFKATCVGSDMTLKRGHGGHLTPFREDEKTSYGDSKNTLNREKDIHCTPTEDHQYSVRTAPVWQVHDFCF